MVHALIEVWLRYAWILRRWLLLLLVLVLLRLLLLELVVMLVLVLVLVVLVLVLVMMMMLVLLSLLKLLPLALLKPNVCLLNPFRAMYRPNEDGQLFFR